MEIALRNRGGDRRVCFTCSHVFMCIYIVYIQIGLGCHNKIQWTGWLNQEKKLSSVLEAGSVNSGCQYSWILVRFPLTCRQLPSHCICIGRGGQGCTLMSLLFKKKNFFFWPSCTVCGILVPRPGITPAPPALEAQSLNYWTAREVLSCLFL